MSNGLDTGIAAQLRRELATDPMVKMGRGLLARSKPGVPAGIGGPLIDLWQSPLFRSATRGPEADAHVELLQLLGLSDPRERPAIPPDARRAVLELSRLVADLPCSAPMSCAAPSVDAVHSCDEDPLDCCAVPHGKPIACAAPGTLVRIHGRGFGTDPEQLVVRFGTARASIVAANGDDLVVMVPIAPEMLNDGAASAFDAPLTIATPGGICAHPFELAPARVGDPEALHEFVDGTRRILGRMTERLATHRPAFERTLAAEPTGGALGMFHELPVLFGSMARAMKTLPHLLARLGSRCHFAERLVAGLLETSGALEGMRHVERELVDPTSALLFGSGVEDAICTVLKWIAIVVLVVVVIFVVIVVIISSAIDGVLPAGEVLSIAFAIVTVFVTIVLIAVTVGVVYGLVKFIGWLGTLAGEAISEYYD